LTGLAGGCACEAVRFVVAGPLGEAWWCHCKRCQRRTGSNASPQVRIDADAYNVVRGAKLISEWTPPTGGFVKAFCSVCGSQLYSRNPADPTRIAPRLGTFDGDPQVRPAYHQRIESAAGWQPLPDDGLPRYEGIGPQTAPPSTGADRS
jgi:hypothetical protein